MNAHWPSCPYHSREAARGNGFADCNCREDWPGENPAADGPPTPATRPEKRERPMDPIKPGDRFRHYSTHTVYVVLAFALVSDNDAPAAARMVVYLPEDALHRAATMPDGVTAYARSEPEFRAWVHPTRGHDTPPPEKGAAQAQAYRETGFVPRFERLASDR
jgi:hypothetical protein